MSDTDKTPLALILPEAVMWPAPESKYTLLLTLIPFPKNIWVELSVWSILGV